jgi:hypothetical protein
MAPIIIPVVKLAMQPALPMTMPVTLVTMAMVSLVVLPVRFSVMVEMVAPVVRVAGMPAGRFAVVVIVRVAVKITAAQDNRVPTIGMGDRHATQQQTCGEQGRLKQGTGFHESDSFSGYLRKQ